MILLKSKFIQNFLQTNFDIVFISETHLTKGRSFEIEKFVDYHNSYSTVNDVKARGGVSCFISPSYLKHISSVSIEIPENIVINFKNGDVVFGSYIAPTDSPYYSITDFSKIANMLVPTNHDRVVLGGGDLNGRVGDVKMPLPNTMKYLRNVDKVVNDHGKEILKICKSFKTYILNNLIFNGKIFSGDFTFKRGDSKSQNDLILANAAAIDSIKTFTIHDISWNPSDHTPVSACFVLNILKEDYDIATSTDLLSDATRSDFTKPRRVKSSQVNWETFHSVTEKDLLSHKEKVDTLYHDKSLPNLDSVICIISKSIQIAAKVSTATTRRQVDAAPQGGIFKVIEDICIRQQNNQQGNAQWERLKAEAIEHIQKDVTLTEQRNWFKVLNSKDPKALWNEINWKGTFTKSSLSEKPSLHDLAAHFAEKGQSGKESTPLCEVSNNVYVPSLDDEITVEEVTSAQKLLKEDKASGDGWVKKMITNVPVSMLLVFQMIFNTILSCHVFPTQWRTTIVNEIFKNKGAPSSSRNYRAISLVQLLAKLFDFILLERFKKWFVPADSQTAYQSKKGSADHVFLLRCMMQHAKRFKCKLFLIAIDFDGAFDRVSRATLIRKLSLFGAGTIFTACLASIYMSTENVIFRDNSYVTYKLFSGIKQGLPSSPLLFLFYINDIFDFF